MKLLRRGDQRRRPPRAREPIPIHLMDPMCLRLRSPFVRQFYGTPSRYLWEDDEGVTHNIDQGEKAARGPHDAVVVLSGATCGIVGSPASVEDELIFAFLDDIYLKLSPGTSLCIVATRVLAPCAHPGA